MLYIWPWVAHFWFWVAVLIIFCNAVLVMLVGRPSGTAKKGYRTWDDAFVLVGAAWLILAFGFYWFSDYLVGTTVFVAVGALLCVEQLRRGFTTWTARREISDPFGYNPRHDQHKDK